MTEAMDEAKQAEREAAEQAARADFLAIARGLGDEAATGALVVVQWLERSRGAGYRRLCRFLLNEGRAALAGVG